ncbi:MAG TPA: MFS transporter [Candidatus Eremiobacteraceae bacterium]|nr:MFS transporter [Candidatus Eremiobacteraceae bacterium]
MTNTEAKKLTQPGASSLWRPLRLPTFRNLMVADVVSDIGTFMQSVGAAWLMVSLHAGPALVALTQTASSLPYFVLALPAGSAGDIFDRRKLILATETWMTAVALLISVLVISGFMSPWLLLLLTFALSAGDAFETPTWRAILPELVPKEDLVAASALNGIEFNLARAVGPALAGIVIAAAGVATAFVANFVSFFGVILVVAKWHRPDRKRTGPPETLTGATVAAIRYVSHSPAILNVVLRTGAVMFFSSALFALLPTVARSVNDSAIGYGLLLGCFGAGAIAGALIMQWARARWSSEIIVSSGVATLGVVTVAMSALHTLKALAPIMLIGGAAWVTFISLISALVQNLAPDWVRARVLAIFILVYQGTFALGSAVWGAIAQRSSIEIALVAAGIGTLATTTFALFAKLPDSTADLTPWNHWRMPVVVDESESYLRQGPVLVTVEYFVIAERNAEFIESIHEYARIRRRDGAYRWGVFRDTEVAERYLEIFLVHSWAEHLRQHERITQADRDLEQRLQSYLTGNSLVRHLIYEHSTET